VGVFILSVGIFIVLARVVSFSVTFVKNLVKVSLFWSFKCYLFEVRVIISQIDWMNCRIVFYVVRSFGAFAISFILCRLGVFCGIIDGQLFTRCFAVIYITIK